VVNIENSSHTKKNMTAQKWTIFTSCLQHTFFNKWRKVNEQQHSRTQMPMSDGKRKNCTCYDDVTPWGRAAACVCPWEVRTFQFQVKISFRQDISLPGSNLPSADISHKKTGQSLSKKCTKPIKTQTNNVAVSAEGGKSQLVLQLASNWLKCDTNLPS